MFTKSPNESTNLYKIDEYLNEHETDYYACFEKEPKSEGAFRYCYSGKIKDLNEKNISNDYFPNGNCVVKVFKKKLLILKQI